jgi:hypothetical protein
MRALRRGRFIAVSSSLSALVLACGGGGGGGPAGAPESRDRGDEGGSGAPATQALDRLKDADDRVKDTGTRLRDGISSCTGKPARLTTSCFGSMYAPYGRAVRDIRRAIDRARATARGRCRVLLDKVEDTAVDELELVSRSTRSAFQDGRYDDVDSHAFSVAFSHYRAEMDDALSACEP